MSVCTGNRKYKMKQALTTGHQIERFPYGGFIRITYLSLVFEINAISKACNETH